MDTILEDRLIYSSPDDRPMYEGVYGITHEQCTSIALSYELDHPIDIDILYGKDGKSDDFFWNRILLETQLTQDQVTKAIKAAGKDGKLKEAYIYLAPTTTFEILTSDKPQSVFKEIWEMPLGEITSYRADHEQEEFTVRAPQLNGATGKDILINLEDRLHKDGIDIELLRYRKLKNIEPSISKIAESWGPIPALWLKPEEVEILEYAIGQGFFETPKGATLSDLSEELDLSKTQLNERMRSINRKLLNRFMNMMQKPLPP